MLGLKLNHVSKRGPRRLHIPSSYHTISYSWYNHVQGLAQKYYFSMHGDQNILLIFCRWYFLMKILASYWVSIILLHTRITMIYLESTVGFNDLCDIFIFISTDCKHNLLIVAQWCHMASWNFVIIGSGNGLSPDGTKPLPEPVFTSHHWSASPFTWSQLHWECSSK